MPDNIPHEFYDRKLADQALGDVQAVLDCVGRFVTSSAQGSKPAEKDEP